MLFVSIAYRPSYMPVFGGPKLPPVHLTAQPSLFGAKENAPGDVRESDGRGRAGQCGHALVKSQVA